MTKASSFKSIYSKSIKASKMRKRETIHKLLGLLLVMAVALAAWALPLSIHSPTEAQVGSTSISVVPSQVSVDVTQAEFFNVSVWVHDVPDLFGYQVALEVNDSIISINRGWVPRKNSSWVFFDKTFIGTEPGFLDRNEDGRNEWVFIGDSLLFEADVFTGNGLLATIELHVERSPATAVLNIDNPPRPGYWSTELLDYNIDDISATKNNGQVQITGEVVEKYPSQITISADPAEATVGEEVVLTGNLSGIKDADVQPIPNADISLQRKLSPIVWVDIGKVKTNETGHFRLVWLTDDTGAIEVRGKWDGDETFKGEISDAVTVHIIEIVTSLEIVFADPDQKSLGHAAAPIPTVPGTFNVTVMNVTDLYEWKTKIYFDPCILSFGGAWLPADNVFSPNYTASAVETGSDEYGSYVIMSANLTEGEGFTGDGTLFQMNFTGLRPTAGLPPNYLTFSTDYGDRLYTYLRDSTKYDIPFKAKEGQVTVEGELHTEISVVNPETGEAVFNFYVQDSPVGSKFNATLVIRSLYNAFNMSGWRVKLSFNNALISPVKVFHPTGNPDYVFHGQPSINDTTIEERYLLLQDTLTPGETPVTVGLDPKLLTVVQFEIIYAPSKPWEAHGVNTILNIAHPETAYYSRGYWLPVRTQYGIYSYSARGQINGTVTDADTGLPLSGAKLSANGFSSMTDASGFYSIKVAPRTYNITAEVTDYASDTVFGVSVAADETVTVDFALSPVVVEVAWINGTVTDAETGLPIEGAWIRIDTFRDVTDASGFYEVKVATGTYEVDAEMQPGYVSNMAVGVSVAAGQTATVNLSLSPAMSAVQNPGLPTLKEDGGEFVLQTDSPSFLTYHANESIGFPRDPPPGFTQFGQEGSFEITYSRPAGVSNNESVASLFAEFDWPYDEPPDRFMGSLSLLVLGSTDDLGELDVQVQVDVYLGRADGKRWRLWPSPTVAGKCNMPIGFIEDVSRRVVDSRTGLVLARFPWKIVYPRSGQQTIDGWIISRDSAASKGGHIDSRSNNLVNDFTEFTGENAFPCRAIFTGSGKYVLSLNITFLDQGAPGEVETTVFVDDFGLLMHRPASTWIEGTITDADTGLPLEGATVSAVAFPSSYSGFTDASGFYSFEIAADLTYNVTGEMEGYISDTVTGVSVHEFQAVTAHFSLQPTTIAEVPSIESCDSTGACKDVFDLDDTVYVCGSGYASSLTTVSSYDVYVVNDVAWSDGMPIPARVPGTVTTVTSDSLGNISPTAVWLFPLTPGRYDVIVDVNSNGVYDAEIDALDDNDIEVTAGFFAIPEYLVGTIMSLIGFFTALGLFYTRKRKRE